MLRYIKRWSSSESILSLLLITLVSLLTFTPFIPWFGFYSDDWFLIWAGLTNGTQGFVDIMAVDRPFAAYPFALGYLLIGPNPLLWQLFVLIIRLIGAYCLWGLLRILWPRLKFETTLITILFMIYPGSLRYPLALKHYVYFLCITLFLFSLIASIYAQKVQKRVWAYSAAILAIVSALLSMLFIEIFVAFEPLRFILLFYIASVNAVSTPIWQQIRASLMQWMMYWPTAILFCIWRFFFFSSERETTNLGGLLDDYKGSPVSALTRLVRAWPVDFSEATLFGWFIPGQKRLRSADLDILVVSAVIGILAIAAIVGYRRWLKRHDLLLEEDSHEATISIQHMLIMGLVLVGIGIVPVLVVNLEIQLLTYFDQYTLLVSAWVSLATVAGICYLTRPAVRTGVLTALVFISVITHILNGNQYRVFTEQERDTWWQLSWRAPQIEEGVSVLYYPANLDEDAWKASDVATTGQNLFYDFDGRQIVTYAFSMNEIVDNDVTEKALNQIVVSIEGRLEYEADLAHVVVVAMPRGGSCLRVIDQNHIELPPRSSGVLAALGVNSDTSYIVAEGEPPDPPKLIFGEEPLHTWCYYFQKAELARQQADWEQIARLDDMAMENGFEPRDQTEWIAFIDGYSHLAQYDRARELIDIVIEEVPLARRDLCRLLDQLEQDTSSQAEQTAFISETLTELSCVTE